MPFRLSQRLLRVCFHSLARENRWVSVIPMIAIGLSMSFSSTCRITAILYVIFSPAFTKRFTWIPILKCLREKRWRRWWFSFWRSCDRVWRKRLEPAGRYKLRRAWAFAVNFDDCVVYVITVGPIFEVGTNSLFALQEIAPIVFQGFDIERPVNQSSKSAVPNYNLSDIFTLCLDRTQ